jgi:hypothetical protein
VLGGCGVWLTGPALPPRLHAALTAGFGGTLAVVGEVARVIARATTAVAMLSAAAPGLDRLFTVVRKIAGIAGAWNARRASVLGIMLFHASSSGFA